MNKDSPAFPFIGEREFCSGMTMREYYAGLAMQGLLSHPATEGKSYRVSKEVAAIAAQCADALIARLNQDEEK